MVAERRDERGVALAERVGRLRVAKRSCLSASGLGATLVGLVGELGGLPGLGGVDPARANNCAKYNASGAAAQVQLRQVQRERRGGASTTAPSTTRAASSTHDYHELF